MEKKIIKILSIVMMFLLLIASTNFFVEATITGSFRGATGFEGKDEINKIISTILAIVRTIGIGVALCILMVIGCKYMLASAGERAEIKKYAINYVIGAVVLFAATGIITIIKTFVDGLEGGTP